MTRERAAEICQYIKFMVDKEYYSEEVEEALDVAIGALEQEPSCRNTRQVDLISREQAIKEISDEFENEWEEADVNFNHGLNMALSIIKALSVLDQDKIIHCKDCKFIRWEEDEEYYYCALEDRPNRNWSVVETDFCSWAERQEPKRGEKAKTLFMNLYNCEKFVNLSNGVVYMKIPKCSIYDEIGREWIVNCVRQDNFECCFTHAFEQVERIEGERSQNCVKCKHYTETEDENGVHSQCGLESDTDGSD